MPENITLKFISEKSGFSPSTVSRVINGNAREYRISRETEKKILEIAEKYGYKPNPIAVNLRVKKSYTIGLVIPTLDNSFFVNVTSILNRTFADKGYNIILTESNDDPEIEKQMIQQLLERNIDGLLLIPCQERDQNLSLLEEKYKNGLPVICIDRYLKDSIIPYITTNNEKGAREAVSYLIKKGHKRIACIEGLKKSSTSQDRREGYLIAHEEAGLEPFYIDGNDFSTECGYNVTISMLKKKVKPTAIFAMSNTIALGVMKAAKEYNIDIPEKLSLIGFDDSIYLDYLSTPLTTIKQPIEQIGEMAVEALTRHIDQEKNLSEWRNVFVDPKLIIRKSVRN